MLSVLTRHSNTYNSIYVSKEKWDTIGIQIVSALLELDYDVSVSLEDDARIIQFSDTVDEEHHIVYADLELIEEMKSVFLDKMNSSEDKTKTESVNSNFLYL